MSETTIPGGIPEDASGLLAPRRHPDLLVYRLHWLAKAAGDRAGELCRQSFSISRRQLRTMSLLAGGVQRSPTELADLAGVDRGRMSRILDELERRGFIQSQRVAGDARRQVLSLTPAGERLYENLFGELRELHAQMLAALQPADREALARILPALEATLGVERPPAP